MYALTVTPNATVRTSLLNLLPERLRNKQNYFLLWYLVISSLKTDLVSRMKQIKALSLSKLFHPIYRQPIHLDTRHVRTVSSARYHGDKSNGKSKYGGKKTLATDKDTAHLRPTTICPIDSSKKVKGKATRITGLWGPEGSGRLRLQITRHSVHEGGKAVTLTHRPPSPPGISWYSFLEAQSTPGHTEMSAATE